MVWEQTNDKQHKCRQWPKPNCFPPGPFLPGHRLKPAGFGGQHSAGSLLSPPIAILAIIISKEVSCPWSVVSRWALVEMHRMETPSNIDEMIVIAMIPGAKRLITHALARKLG